MRLLPGLVCALLLTVPVAAAEKGLRLSQPYASQPVGAFCGFELPAGECPSVPNNRAQFGPLEGARVADIAIEDATGLDVGAAYLFLDRAGEIVKRGGLCDAATRVRVPSGAAYLVVVVDMPHSEVRNCDGPASTGTTGTVTVRLR